MWSRLHTVKWEVLLAAVSLIAALVFNSLQVRDGADAARQAKVATELGLLTQLQGALDRSIYSRVPYQKQFQELRTGKRLTLTSPAYRALVEEGSNLNYFAWLFNKRYLTTPGADELWGPRMICEWKQALAPGIKDAAQNFSDLLMFVQTRGPRLSQLGPC